VGNNKKISVDLLIRNFGSENGILIVTDFDTITNYIDDITNLGYGFSVMTDPNNNERIELNDYIDVLKDWGWTGPEDKAPSWV
jgi:hypothetical protein